MEEDRELAELRKRRASQVQQEAAQRAVLEEQQARMEARKQAVLRSILTPEARERLGTLKMTRPDLVSSVEEQLIMLAQSGRLGNTVIDDATLKSLLQRMMPQKKEITIKRR